MEMCYDGALVMPSNFVVMNEEEMTYVEGGGHLKLVCSEAFARDCIAAGSTAAGTLIGAAIGSLCSGGAASIIGSAIGAAIGWIVGGWISRGVHGKQVIYDGYIPKINPGYLYLR